MSHFNFESYISDVSKLQDYITNKPERINNWINGQNLEDLRLIEESKKYNDILCHYISLTSTTTLHDFMQMKLNTTFVILCNKTFMIFLFTLNIYNNLFFALISNYPPNVNFSKINESLETNC